MPTPAQELINKLVIRTKRDFAEIKPGDLKSTSLRDCALIRAFVLTDEQLELLAVASFREDWSGLHVAHRLAEPANGRHLIWDTVAAKIVATIIEDDVWVNEHVRQGGGAVHASGIFDVEGLISAEKILSDPLG